MRARGWSVKFTILRKLRKKLENARAWFRIHRISACVRSAELEQIVNKPSENSRARWIGYYSNLLHVMQMNLNTTEIRRAIYIYRAAQASTKLTSAYLAISITSWKVQRCNVAICVINTSSDSISLLEIKCYSECALGRLLNNVNPVGTLVIFNSHAWPRRRALTISTLINCN